MGECSVTDRTYGEAFADKLQEVADAAIEVQIAIRDRFTPAIRRAAYAIHVWHVGTMPWWRVWWHTMTGHRR